jgi:hypothetical protein
MAGENVKKNFLDLCGLCALCGSKITTPKEEAIIIL